MRVVTVGHVTNDHLAQAVVPGGAALYAGLAAAALGAEVTLVTRAGADFVGRHLFRQFQRVHALAARQTTTFDERYVGEARVARLLARAGAVDVPLPSADVVLLCPVTDEVPDAALTLGQSCFLAAGLQGWLRSFAADGSSQARPLTAPSAFAGCHLVSCSEEDLAGLGPETLEALRAAVRVVAVTEGAAGARLYCGAQAWRVSALPVEAVDPTGAGDVFLATLAMQLARGTPLLEAGAWAACAGALTVTAVGPTGLEGLSALPQALQRYRREARPPVPLTTVG
jgi:sugar/nucleoside kinase (ribokinase family)